MIRKEVDGVDDVMFLEIPKPLAHYLTTHHNGSVKFREELRADAQNELRSKIKSLLEFRDKAPG
jgi:hypothetical protein